MDIKQEDDYNLDSYAELASNTFDFILEQIKNSSLNFQLQLSPFSAYISLKKSLVKDKNGVPQLPKLAPDAHCIRRNRRVLDRCGCENLPEVCDEKIDNYEYEDISAQNCDDVLTCKSEPSKELSDITARERKILKKERQKKRRQVEWRIKQEEEEKKVAVAKVGTEFSEFSSAISAKDYSKSVHDTLGSEQSADDKLTVEK